MAQKHQLMTTADLSQFSLETVFSASYSLADKATFIFDRKDQELQVTMIPKESHSPDMIAAFHERVSEISSLHKEAEKNQEIKREMIRQAIVQQSIPKMQEVGFEDKNLDELEASLLEFEQESLEDPLGISTQWNEWKDTGRAEQDALHTGCHIARYRGFFREFLGKRHTFPNIVYG
jgi:hypothetical protein